MRYKDVANRLVPSPALPIDKKDVVIFGKGSGSQPVPNENGMTPMWKKKSIFWECTE